MRMTIFMMPILLAACSSAPEPTQKSDPIEDGLWMADRGSGFCKGAEGAEFVIFAEDGSNCMAEGAVEAGEDGELAFIPRGDRECTIPMTQDGDVLSFGEGGEACRYYCGGTARLSGQALRRSTATDERLQDAAGDPLC